MHPFRKAVEDRDAQAMIDLLAENVAFTSPVAFKPYPGKAITGAILRAVLRVFEDFAYVREIGDPEGRDHALVFTATVGGKQLQGCDFLHLDEDGRIDELTVMVRPLSGAQALAAAMAAEFDRIAAEAAEVAGAAGATGGADAAGAAER
ncbi:nuclear transport factor 2 family protein [Streptomyces sp. NRRL S-495]|uniref:nuclear transport factor 2 family protein n=1 Tax=Streptomyces sp. NRRL S-495 TaxID=1609133 RepID=UPI0005F93359|nr:nuclear transport factor 2 family protein [Streptomyces sp. NRRL S-495]KJY32812.1 membrane protein [Streptomyces sp. NRRL S-495]